MSYIEWTGFLPWYACPAWALTGLLAVCVLSHSPISQALGESCNVPIYPNCSVLLLILLEHCVLPSGPDLLWHRQLVSVPSLILSPSLVFLCSHLTSLHATLI